MFTCIKNIDVTKISALQVLWGQKNPLRPTSLASQMGNVGRRDTILGLTTFYAYIYCKMKHLAKFKYFNITPQLPLKKANSSAKGNSHTSRMGIGDWLMRGL